MNKSTAENTVHIVRVMSPRRFRWENILSFLLVCLSIFFTYSIVINLNRGKIIRSYSSSEDGIFIVTDTHYKAQFGNKNDKGSHKIQFEATPTKQKDETNIISEVKTIVQTLFQTEKKIGLEFYFTKAYSANSPENIYSMEPSSTLLSKEEGGRVVWNKNVIEGVDFKYQLIQQKGVKEDIILNKPGLPNTYEFELVLEPGVSVKKQLTGTNHRPAMWYFVDENGNYLAHFEPPYAQDSAGKITTDVELEVIKDHITLIVNQEWLEVEGRAYPVTIDPSIVHDTQAEFDEGTYQSLIASSTPEVDLLYNELHTEADSIALWHMNETSDNTCSGGEDVCDSSRRGNHGTSVNTTITTANQQIGDAARYFNGTNAYYSSPSVNLGNKFTIETWIRVESASTFMMIASNTTSGNTDDGFRFYVNSWSTSNRRITLETANGSVGFTTNTRIEAVDLNTWTHVALLVDRLNGRGEIYVNGVNATSASGVSTSFKISAALNIGRTTNGQGYYKGYIDEFRITGRLLTPDEIKADAGHFPQGVYTSKAIDLGTTLTSVDEIQWTESGVATGDGETPYLSTNLIGHWKFNETSGTTAADSSGNGNSGTLNGMSGCTSSQDSCANSGWTSTNKKWGTGSIMFDGTDDYVQYSNPTSFNYGTADFTIEAWIRLNTLGHTHVIFTKTASGSWTTAGKQFMIYSVDNKLYFDAYALATIKSTQTLNTGRWYHVAVTFNDTSNTIKLYVNGKQDGEGTANLTADDPTHILTTGPHGILDTLRFYQRELSADEILSDYQAGQVEFQTRTGTDNTPDDGGWESWKPVTSESQIDSMDSQYQYNTTDSGLVAYYPIDENTDNTCSGGLDVCDVKGTTHGTESGGSKIIQGKYKNARYFDGSDDYVYWNSPPWNDDAEGTFAAWIKYKDYGTTYQRIFAKTSPTEWTGWDETLMIRLRDDDHTIDYRVFYGNVEVFLAKTNIPLPENEWVHIAVTVSTANGTKMYVNGVEQGLTYTTGSASSHYWFSDINTGATETTLGCFRDESLQPCHYYYNGLIDEVQIYDRGISASEIKNIYLEGVDNHGIDTINLQQDSAVKYEGTASKKITTGLSRLDGDTVGLWHFEETSGTGAYIKDSSGNGNHATPSGTEVVSGISGKARDFTNDAIEAPLVSTETQNITMETWVYWKSTSAMSSIFYNGESGSSGYGIYVSNGSCGAGNEINVVLGGKTCDAVSSTTTLSSYEWTYIALTRNTSTWSLYVNGELKHTGTTNPNIPATGTKIGAYAAGVGEYFTGIIDEVSFTEREKTAKEIAETYRLGRNHYFSTAISSTDFTGKTKMPFWITADKPGTYLQATTGESPYVNYEPDTSTVGLWRLEESSGYCKNGVTGCIQDDSGYGNNGSVGSSPSLVNGRMGQARKFNGTTDYIGFGDVLDNVFAGEDKKFTIEAWIKPGATMTSNMIIAKLGDVSCSENQRQFDLDLYTSSRLLFTWHGSLTAGVYRGIIGSTSIVDTNHWYHIVIAYDGTIDTNDGLDRVSMYVDGVKESVSMEYASGNLVDAYIKDGSAHFSVAKNLNSSGSPCGSSNYFNGSIDEVRISNIVRTADEIRQSYEMGRRTHSLTIDFGASLQSGYLISNSTDYSFRVDATIWGAQEFGNNLYPGDKIIVSENVDGTTYIAQGTVTAITLSTGETTVASWDTGSTFPSGGYSANATIMKWERKYLDIRGVLPTQQDAVTRVNFKFINGVEGRTIWIDDIKSAGPDLTDPTATLNITNTDQRYIQYRFIATTSDPFVTPSVNSVTINYTEGTNTSAPAFTVPPFEDPSSTSASPTNTGNNVTFKATATDADADDYYLAICKTDAVSANSQSAPTCTGGEWCVSNLTSSGNQANCSYPVTGSENETEGWYAFVCDYALGSLCSTSSQGTGDSGSPFKVNHQPSFSTINSPTADPGSNVTFTATASDSDVDDTADQVRLVVCSDTSGATYSGCSGTQLCISGDTSSNPSCQYTLSSVQEIGPLNAYAYVFDSHQLGSTDNYRSTTYSANNVAPAVTNVTLNGGSNISLTENTTTGIQMTATISDNNSCTDISSVTASLYRSAITYTGCDNVAENDDDSCYALISCSVVSSGNTCDSITDAAADYECTINMQYHADPTDTNTQYPAENWLGAIKAIDNSAANGNTEVASGVELLSLSALNINLSKINFGSMTVSTDTGSSPVDSIISATGNVGIDVELSGTNMTYSSYIIPVGNLEHSFTTFTYGAGTDLTGSATEYEMNCPKTYYSGSTTIATTHIYWGLRIPSIAGSGVYSGTNTLTAVKSEVGEW